MLQLKLLCDHYLQRTLCFRTSYLSRYAPSRRCLGPALWQRSCLGPEGHKAQSSWNRLISELKFFSFNTLCSPCYLHVLRYCFVWKTNRDPIQMLYKTSKKPWIKWSKPTVSPEIGGAKATGTRSCVWKGIRSTNECLCARSLRFASLWGDSRSLRSLHSVYIINGISVA